MPKILTSKERVFYENLYYKEIHLVTLFSLKTTELELTNNRELKRNKFVWRKFINVLSLLLLLLFVLE